jgi:hypothetical protein
VTETKSQPEIVYGAKAIGEQICEPDRRRVFYLLENNYVPGAWKAGRGWALTVPVFRRTRGLDGK